MRWAAVACTVVAAALLIPTAAVALHDPSAVALQLHDLVKAGDADGVRHVCDAGCNLDATDATGRTPLHWAAARGDAATVAVLTQLHADPNARDADNNTPLDVVPAAAPPSVRHLLQAATSPLFHAAQSGDAARVQSLAAAQPGAAHATDWRGRCIVHYAAASGSLATLHAALAATSPAAISARDSHGYTPLHTVAVVPETVAAMLAAGADAAAVAHDGSTVLHTVAATAADSAAAAHAADTPDVHLGAGAVDAPAVGTDDGTQLRRFDEVVRRLAVAGAVPHAVSHTHGTLLHVVAPLAGTAPLIKHLIRKFGLSPNARHNGFSPYDLAVAAGAVDAEQLLAPVTDEADALDTFPQDPPPLPHDPMEVGPETAAGVEVASDGDAGG